MGRKSNIQKQVQSSVQSVPKRPRKKRVVRLPPVPFRIGSIVAVTAPDDFKGMKLGIIRNVCKDGGLNVSLTLPRREGIAENICIHTERGHTIQLLSVEAEED